MGFFGRVGLVGDGGAGDGILRQHGGVTMRVGYGGG